MSKIIYFIFIACALPIELRARHVSPPLDEWVEKYGEQQTLRYGTLGAAKRMAGYIDGPLTEDDFLALANFMETSPRFFEQRNAIQAIAGEMNRVPEESSTSFQNQIIGRIVQKLRTNNQAQESGDQINSIEHSLKAMIGIKNPELVKLSKEWVNHEDLNIREAANQYLTFSLNHKSRPRVRRDTNKNSERDTFSSEHDSNPKSANSFPSSNAFYWALGIGFLVFLGLLWKFARKPHAESGSN